MQEVKQDEITNKMFLLRNGRIVSVTSSAELPSTSLTAAELEVSVKEPLDDYFHAPIQKAHPNYPNLETLDAGRQRILQLKYSGLSKKEIALAIESLSQLQ